MKKHYILLIIGWLFCVNFSHSQNRIDSLKKVLKTAKEVDKFKLLNDIADEYSNSDLDLAMKFAKQSLLQAQKSERNQHIALAYNSIANVFQYQSQLDSALTYHRKALQLRMQLNDSLGIADSFNNIGIANDQKAIYPEALTNYFKALHIYEKKNDLEKQAMVNTNIGIVYKAQKDYKKALKYYQEAYRIYTEIKNDFGITVSSGNLGSILINFKKYNESIKYSQISREGYKKLGYDRFEGYPISNIAVVYDSLHQFPKANANYIESIRIHEKYNNGYEVADISKAFADCLFKQKRYNEVIQYANKAVEFGKKSDGNLLVIEAYEILAKAYQMTGDYQKAYAFSRLYSKGKDEVFESEKTKTVFELEAKYQTEKKEKLLLKKEVEAKKKNTTILVLSLLAIFTALLGFLIYRQQRLKNKQQEQEFQLKSAIAQIENQNQLQEQRLSISRDLHDNIGAQLTFVISSVDNLKYGNQISDNRVVNQLTKISDFTKSTIIELRDTIWAMNNNEFSFDDLRSRIFNFIEKAKSAKEEVLFKFNVDSQLSDTRFTSLVGINVYRVIQEAINNAIKYSDAKNITVEVEKNNNQIKITIQDDGKGFDLDTADLGNGIQNMKKRIEDVGGTFELVSEPNKGTQISFFIV